MQRRTLLKRGLFGGALLAVGGGTALALFPSRRVHAPRRPLAALDEARFNVMAAIAARVVVVEGADPVEIAHTVDDALARAVPEARSDLLSVLGLLESALVGALLDARLRPFTQLDPEDQDRVLLAWRDSRLTLRRGAYKALKNLCVTSFYRKESGWAAAGYPGPPDYLSNMAPAAPKAAE